jgi:uncharacterized protein (DUF433 family)
MYENLLSHIITESAVNSGRATVRDTYITVAEILDKFAGGQSAADILGDYPPLSHLGLQAALAYAAHVVRQADEQAGQTAQPAAAPPSEGFEPVEGFEAEDSEPAAPASEELSSSEGT